MTNSRISPGNPIIMICANIHYEYDWQRKRTKYTVPQVDKGTSLHCYYVKMCRTGVTCIFTFLHNSSEGMFLVYLRNCIFCLLYLSVMFIVIVPNTYRAGQKMEERYTQNGQWVQPVWNLRIMRKNWTASIFPPSLFCFHLKLLMQLEFGVNIHKWMEHAIKNKTSTTTSSMSALQYSSINCPAVA